MKKSRNILKIVIMALLIFGMLCIGGCGNASVPGDGRSEPTATFAPTREDIVKLYKEVCEEEGRYVQGKYMKRLKGLFFPDKNPKEVSDKELEKRYYEIIDREKKEKIEKSKEPKLIAQNVERIKNNMFLSDGKLYRREPNKNVLIYDKPIKDFWSFGNSYVIYDIDNNVWFYESINYLENWYRRSRELKGFYYIPDGEITNELQLAVEGAEKVWVGAKGFAYMKEGRLFSYNMAEKNRGSNKDKLMEYKGSNIEKIKDIIFNSYENIYLMENGEVYVHLPWKTKKEAKELVLSKEKVYQGGYRSGGVFWGHKYDEKGKQYSERYLKNHAEYYRGNFTIKDDGTTVLRYIVDNDSNGFYAYYKTGKKEIKKNVKWFESNTYGNLYCTLYNNGDLTKFKMKVHDYDQRTNTVSCSKGKERLIAKNVQAFSIMEVGALFYVTNNGELYFKGEVNNYPRVDVWSD